MALCGYPVPVRRLGRDRRRCGEGELLAESDRRDHEEAVWQAVWRNGWAARGIAERVVGVAERAAGYAEAVADIKAAEHTIYSYLAGQAEIDRCRWIVRGEVRFARNVRSAAQGRLPGRGGEPMVSAGLDWQDADPTAYDPDNPFALLQKAEAAEEPEQAKLAIWAIQINDGGRCRAVHYDRSQSRGEAQQGAHPRRLR